MKSMSALALIITALLVGCDSNARTCPGVPKAFASMNSCARLYCETKHDAALTKALADIGDSLWAMQTTEKFFYASVAEAKAACAKPACTNCPDYEAARKVLLSRILHITMMHDDWTRIWSLRKIVAPSSSSCAAEIEGLGTKTLPKARKVFEEAEGTKCGILGEGR